MFGFWIFLSSFSCSPFIRKTVDVQSTDDLEFLQITLYNYRALNTGVS